jgi:hypothetical protein
MNEKHPQHPPHKNPQPKREKAEKFPNLDNDPPTLPPPPQKKKIPRHVPRWGVGGEGSRGGRRKVKPGLNSPRLGCHRYTLSRRDGPVTGIHGKRKQ